MIPQSSHPETWAEITLGEINQYRSKNVQPKDFPDESFELWSVPLFPTGKPEVLLGMEIGSSKQVVEPRDVLISKINPRINRVWEVDQKSSYRQIASSEWITVRQPLMESRYLLRFFQSSQFRTRLCADVTGVGGSLTRAQPKKVATFPVPVPPLAEQKVIAEKLDTLLAQVETTKARLERIPQILKRFRQSVLAAAVSGRLTSIPGEIFETVPIAQLAKQQKYSLGIGPFGSNLKVSDYREAGHPLVFVREIRASKFGDDTTKFVSDEKFDELKPHRVVPGDILITKMGDPPGDVAIYPSDRPEAVITADCIKLSIDESVNCRDYIAYAMQSEPFRRDVLSISAGVAQQKVSLTKFRRLTLRVPPLEEQVEIVHRVNQLFAHADRIEQQVQAAMERVQHLTQSILAKAFRGELTEQWRKDNPELISGENSAEALLERIKVERAAMKPAKRTRKSKTNA